MKPNIRLGCQSEENSSHDVRIKVLPATPKATMSMEPTLIRKTTVGQTVCFLDNDVVVPRIVSNAVYFR